MSAIQVLFGQSMCITLSRNEYFVIFSIIFLRSPLWIQKKKRDSPINLDDKYYPVINEVYHFDLADRPYMEMVETN
jgi:hypothetical protein